MVEEPIIIENFVLDMINYAIVLWLSLVVTLGTDAD